MLRSAIFPLVAMFLSTLPFASFADCMGPYPPSMVKAFNDNCAKDPAMTSFCTCLMDDVQKNIPLADFIEIGNSAGGINSDPRFVKSSKKCSSLITGSAPTSNAPGSPAPSSATTGTAGSSVKNQGAGTFK